MKRMSDLLQVVKHMSMDERQGLVAQIVNMMHNNFPSKESDCNDLVSEHLNGKPDCPHCRAEAKLGLVVKRGHNKNGAQRFFCKSCGRIFVATTNTVFERSRKSAEVWKKFIQMTISGDSLEFCAAECNIAIQTAFSWRHKILNAFRVNQQKTMMFGRVEIDEMLIPISYKGNHIKGTAGTQRVRKHGEPNNLPRESYSRGSDNRSTSSRDKACVFCMVEDGDKTFYASVPGVGFMNAKMLDKTVGAYINKETAMVLADQYKLTRNYLRDNQYHFMTLASNASGKANGHKPEIQGENREFHLQHINAMHHHIRLFLRGYCGVSTKYLENYLSLYIWLKVNQAAKQKKRVRNASIARAAYSDCYIAWKDIRALPAVPVCA